VSLDSSTEDPDNVEVSMEAPKILKEKDLRCLENNCLQAKTDRAAKPIQKNIIEVQVTTFFMNAALNISIIRHTNYLMTYLLKKRTHFLYTDQDSLPNFPIQN
jgi:hypothetical protein